MDDLSFLEQLQSGDYGSNNATLNVVLPDGQVLHISDRISPYRLFDNCPLLYHAFEHGYQSRMYASIDAPSRTAAIALLRYCYTDNYLPPDIEDMPLRFLPHAQVYKMSEDFDIPALQLLAHGNFSCQVDYACSVPGPPHDLIETIRYLYIYFSSQESRGQQSLLDTLLNYCISVFQYHKLGQRSEFLEVVRQIPELRQDLCRTNMARNFQDDCAHEIIQLALDMLQPQPNPRPTLLASRDLPKEMLVDRPASLAREIALDPVRNAANTSQVEDFRLGQDNVEDGAAAPFAQGRASTLVWRPKNQGPVVVRGGFDTDSSSSEDEGFTVVHRPKPQPCATPASPPRPSSPVASSSQEQPEPSSALQDYQMQLMLLEQQNKKRLLIARRQAGWLIDAGNTSGQKVTTTPSNMSSPEAIDSSGDMSSPEIIPSNPEKKPVDILATTGSDYSDDDDWTML